MATDAEQLIIELTAKTQQFQREMRAALGVFDKTGRQMERRQIEIGRNINRGWSNFTRGLVPSLAGIGAVLSTREIIAYADAWTTAGNKIAAAGTPISQQSQRLKELADTAVATNSAFEGTVTTYARLIRSTEGLGKSEAELLKITETINKAFVVGGAAASERAAGSLQLTQALSSGILAGDELRSLRENAPLIAKAIADAMGTSIGGLKELGAQGKITSAIIIQALEKLGPSVEKQFATTKTTVADALQNLETRFTQFVGKLSESGVTQAAAAAIGVLADNFDDLARAAGVAAAALAPLGVALAVRATITALGALSAAILANPLLALAALTASAVAALVLYSDKIDIVTGAINQEREAHEFLTAALFDAEGNTRAMARADVLAAQKKLQLAQATLKAAEAQALQNLAINKSADVERSTGFGVRTGLRTSNAQGVKVGSEQLQAVREAMARNLSDQFRAGQALIDSAAVEGKKLTATAAKAKGPKGENARDTFAARLDTEVARANADLIAAQNELNVQLARGTEAYFGAVMKQIEDEKNARLEEIEAERKQRTTALDQKKFGHAEYQKQIADINAVAAARTKQAEVEAKARAQEVGQAGFIQASRIQLADQIAGIESETKALGLVGEALVRVRYIEERLNEARKQGIPITKELVDEINREADALGRVAGKADEAAKASEKEIAVADEIRQGLEDIGVAALNGSKSFKEAVGQMLKDLAILILKLYVLKPLIESVMGAPGTGFASIGKVFGFANGGRPPVGRASWVGERGKELFVPDVPGTIIPNNALRNMPTPNGSPAPVFNQTVVIRAEGSILSNEVWARIEAAQQKAALQGAQGGAMLARREFPTNWHRHLRDRV